MGDGTIIQTIIERLPEIPACIYIRLWPVEKIE